MQLVLDSIREIQIPANSRGRRPTALLAAVPKRRILMVQLGAWAGLRFGELTGAVQFFGGPMNSGPTAACGWMHMRAVLGEEFVPADDPARENQCPRFAAIAADGKGFRNPPDPYYRSFFCERYLRVRIEGVVTVKDCSLRDLHDGPHRARDVAEWEIGADDYVPAPAEVGRHITKAS